MSGCTHNCESCSHNCGGKCNKEDLLLTPHADTKIKKIIAVISGKGGVGKSSVTSLLAVSMKQKGYNVGILDADITGPSIPKAFGINERATGNDNYIYPVISKTGIEMISVNLLLQNDTDPVLWRGPVIAGMVGQFYKDVVWKDLDFLFVDMPPGTGDIPLTVFQSLPIDGVIIVTSPQELVGMIVEKALKMANMMNIPVMGIVENMSYFECPKCHEKYELFGKSKLDDLAYAYDIGNTAKLPINPELASLCDKGKIEEIKDEWLGKITSKIEQSLKPEG